MKFTAKIRGKKWEVLFLKELPSTDEEDVGICHYTRRKIYVKPNKNVGKESATLIHETIHAAIPDLDESAVLALEKAIIHTLKKCKYKITKQ